MRIDEIARLLKGKLEGDGAQEIRGVAALDVAGAEDLTFADGPRPLGRAQNSRAGLILIPEGASVPGHNTLAVEHPKLAFIQAVEALRPPSRPAPGIHSSAVISPEARVDSDVTVGPWVVVERGAKIGKGTWLGARVFIGEGAQIGSECAFYPGVVVYPGARIGNRVTLHAGVVIGSDGFGYVLAKGRQHKFPQLGQVIIEDDVEIGANSTVDRGSLGITVVGAGTKIDNLVQVAHNVKIGRHNVIAAQTGISGSVEIGDYVVMGGQVGIGDHARIEDHAVLGGGAGILPGKIVRRGTTVWGRPARPLAEYKRLYAQFADLPSLAEKVKELSRRVSPDAPEPFSRT